MIFIASAMSAPAQPVEVVHLFQESPAFPNGPLVQVPGGTFYGVTQSGIIRLSPADPLQPTGFRRTVARVG